MNFARRAFLAGSVVTALAACSSAPVPIDTYYRLEPVSAAGVTASLKGTVEVAPLRGEGVVNGRALLYRKSPTELQQYSYHFWADTPATMLQRNLVDLLRATKTFDTVVTPDMRLDRAYEIIGTVRKLENDQTGDGSRAVIEIELGVRKVAGNVVMLLKVYSAEAPVSGSGMPAVITALSAAQAQIFNQFLADVVELKG
jgi:cholesterol transport system auxiliary component